MQKKPLTTIQGYFIGSIVLMHLLFGAYYFWGDTPNESTGKGDTVNVIPSSNADINPQSEDQTPPPPQPPEAGHLALDAMTLHDDVYQVPMDGQWQATLSLDPKMQAAANGILKRGKVPAGAIVVLDLATSDVLVLAERFIEDHPVAPAIKEGQPNHFALRRVAPSASVFKIVSAGALLQKGVSGTKTLSYRPAKRRITNRHLKPTSGDPSSDLINALAASNNGYFAAASDRYLNQETLFEMANAFGYNDSVPFPAFVDPSLAAVPAEPLERARMAAGFWHSYLTPLHAAVIAQTIANKGHKTRPRFVVSMTHESGVTQRAPTVSVGRKVLEPKDANVIEKGLRATVTRGTALKSFKKWPAKLKDIRVFGKTGTLGAVKPDRTYTWFVGYTRGTNRDVALAVLAINGERWWRKAPQLAKDFLAQYARKHSLTVGTRKEP